MLNDWNINSEEVVAIVTDIARNIVNAISKLNLLTLYWQRIATWGEEIFDVHTTDTWVGRLVAYFHRCPKSTSKLREKQKLLVLPEHKLLNNCITSWGSTYEMLKRSLVGIKLYRCARECFICTCIWLHVFDLTV